MLFLLLLLRVLYQLIIPITMRELQKIEEEQQQQHTMKHAIQWQRKIFSEVCYVTTRFSIRQQQQQQKTPDINLKAFILHPRKMTVFCVLVSSQFYL